MPAVSEMVHPAGLSFVMQRKVVVLRNERNLSWPDVVAEVKNFSGDRLSVRTVANYYRAFSVKNGRVRSRYSLCGRQPYKSSKRVEQHLLKSLRQLRNAVVCTSRILQLDLAKNAGVKLSCSWIRKILQKHGYKWLPRRQKRLYSKDMKAARVLFARGVLRLSRADLREKLSLAMDGVVLGMPPDDPTDRLNFCRHGDTHIWRKREESCSPDLAGDDAYGKQVPLARAVPMWGGCSGGGFAVVAFHRAKKIGSTEWVHAVRAGKLTKAIKKVHPVRKRGPWRVLCDNEGFMKSRASIAAQKAVGVTLFTCPPSRQT